MKSFPGNSSQKSGGRPGIFLIGLVLLFSFAGVASSDRVNCCPDERTTPPPESAFVKIDLPGSGKGTPFVTWRTKSPGRPILLLHALNGISPSVLHWALEMETWGYRVYLPSLYGDPIQGKDAYGYDEGFEAAKFLAELPEWDLDSTDHPGSIISEVRALAKEVSAKEGNRDIAVIGNCLTGIFPLAVMDEPFVRVAVLAQPAMPVMKFHQILLRTPQPKEKQRALPLSGEHLEPILTAIKTDPTKRVVGFHYAHDPIAPIVKFDEIYRALNNSGIGDQFHAYILEKKRSSYASDRPAWVTGAKTEQSRKMLTPHSTLSNPESLDDRAWFRKQLREELDRAL